MLLHKCLTPRTLGQICTFKYGSASGSNARLRDRDAGETSNVKNGRQRGGDEHQPKDTAETYSPKEKCPIIVAELRGEKIISVLLRREAVAESLFTLTSRRNSYKLGQHRLSGDTARHT